ncbi:putative holin-like toxin [Lactobacillus sp. ESL0677]|nr:putative holin-like toxin [Lactobacillus sp. ESL0677]WEV36682.1 putative holin-like toxin [Lactobacillus sp. ESL0677]
MSAADAIQLMLSFGTFIVALIALIVEIIKLISKKHSKLSGGDKI